MSIRVALIVSAPRELTLTAGRQEIFTPPSQPEEADPPFLKIGRARGDELHLSGPLISDPAHLSSSLSVDWFFPDEELPEEARPVDLSEVRPVITLTPRQRAEFGWHWRYRVESRANSRSIYYFSDGFQPPFRSSDVTLHLEYLVNYNYNGYILSYLDFGHRHPSYTESEWGLPTLESEGFIDDQGQG